MATAAAALAPSAWAALAGAFLAVALVRLVAAFAAVGVAAAGASFEVGMVVLLRAVGRTLRWRTLPPRPAAGRGPTRAQVRPPPRPVRRQGGRRPWSPEPASCAGPGCRPGAGRPRASPRAASR